MAGSSTPKTRVSLGEPGGIEEAARRLLEAESTRTVQPPLTEGWPELDVETAYKIQDRALNVRLELGDALVGLKLGLTSRAKQEQMGVDSPITGWLTDAMRLSSGAPVPFDRLVHPRAEPELAFVMGERLAGPRVTRDSALAAVQHVYASVEILDSRFEAYRFSLPDVVADNGSASRFALGAVARTPDSLDLVEETCVLEVDGEGRSARGAAILGHPGEALALAANALADRGREIQRGWIVLTGGLMDAVPIAAETQVSASFSHLGRIGFGGQDGVGLRS